MNKSCKSYYILWLCWIYLVLKNVVNMQNLLFYTACAYMALPIICSYCAWHLDNVTQVVVIEWCWICWADGYMPTSGTSKPGIEKLLTIPHEYFSYSYPPLLPKRQKEGSSIALGLSAFLATFILVFSPEYAPF